MTGSASMTAAPTATVPLLIQDGTVDLGERAGTPVPGSESRRLTLPVGANDRFLDGPACRRLAVVDFDPETGAPQPPPATFEAARTGGGLRGTYPGDGEADSATALAVNAFGIALQTIRMFEGADALGREVRWAFGGEQLLIVPRAGERANAYYDRATRSLQFFSFTGTSGARVHTALSRDIVAHECGHALLDAVQPSLYDRKTRESQAIHEAVADVIAVLMALDSDRLRTSVLARSGNRLAGANAFSAIAEQFGMAKPSADGIARRALRDLDSRRTLADLADASPHELSTVLSSIFYDTLCAVFETRFARERDPRRADGRPPLRPAAAANKALGTAHVIFRRFVLRGIDYLPPGALAFADVGRATLAADRAIGADRPVPDEVVERRERFAQRFVDRGIAPSTDVLDAPRPAALDVPPEGLAGLRDSDYLAYEYVGRHRAEIGIPDGVPFTVLPRIDATKRVGPVGLPPQRELLLKVGWEAAADASGAGRAARPVPTGVTLSLRWDDGRCLALVRGERARIAASDEPGGADEPGGIDELDDAPLPASDSPGSRASDDLGRFPPVPGRALAPPPPGVDPGAFFDLVKARSGLRRS
ncbi:hypothetical protein FLP10_15480 [Agromyces intestinalis]|uniref:Peptidase M4 domain-containing protein n=1 Tax=Agromyces intestinalis TaxID=2592652 RepID=A0A5C1YI72_9MICO|nr:hypothetical protein [Agromyces intestinalis]QEO15671.1 hypothetical protein FLP10_15480 [Agromyces intestinalis]